MQRLTLILFARLIVAGLGGLAVYASYEPMGVWLAAWFGIAALFIALAPLRWWPFYSGAEPVYRLGKKVPNRTQRLLFALIDDHGRLTARGGFLTGFIHAFVIYFYLLPWIGELVGNMPYIALSVYLALWSGLFGLVATWMGSWRWYPIAFVFWYQAVEWGRSSFPFGGFAWVRLGWGQVDGPLLPLAAYGGPALVGCATVSLGVAIASGLSMSGQAYRGSRPASNAETSRVHRLASLGVVVAIIGGSLLAGAFQGRAEDLGRITAAAIQGNVPRLGLEFNAQRRAVLANHVAESQRLADDEGSDVDIVIWPENSSDVNPFRDATANAQIQQAVAAVNAPILVGTITEDEVGERNTMIVMDPVDGAGEYHYKKFLQPFGEYMPWRSFFRIFSDMVDLAGDFKPGDGTGVVHMQPRSGGDPVAVGVATCYEVAFDAAGRDAVKNGATILTTPTNNATFGFSDMTYQQLAMSRLRAVELDRAVVVAATSGSSAMINPDGSVIEKTDIFEARHLVANLPLRNTLTFATRYGLYVEYLLVIIGTLCAAWALRNRSLSRKNLTGTTPKKSGAYRG